MAKVYDVPADVLIQRLANILKNEDIPAPSWTPFVKTGAHADNLLKTVNGGILDVHQL